MQISAKPVTVLALVALSGALSHATALSDAPRLLPNLLRAPAATTPPATALQDDVDAFMEKVLEKREINWDHVYNYVFGEVEKLRIRGVEIAALQSFDQEYTWYVRDGYLVRSPWKINGVEVDDETREKEELEWIERVKDEEEETRIERDSFFNFEFEPGNYLFTGREMFEGREVVRIEYYPTSLFFRDEEDRQRRRDDGDDRRARHRDADDRSGGRDDEDNEFGDYKEPAVGAGVTYGARFTWIDLLGINEHLSIPLTWGGEKQARVALTFDLDRAAITRIDGGFGILRHENPHYEIDDTRVGGLQVDVAYGFQSDSVRVHFSTGFRY